MTMENETIDMFAAVVTNEVEDNRPTETISISVNRGNLLTLGEAEDFIRNTVEKYSKLVPLFVADYSSINYNRGFWNANITLTSDPNGRNDNW